MKKNLFFLLIPLLLIFGCSTTSKLSGDHPETKLGWKLGAQAYTFKNVSFFEAVDKIKMSELSFVEAYPGQTLGGGFEGKMDYQMPAEKRNQILQKLKEKGVKMLSFGVISTKDPTEWRKIFEFAKAMGLQAISTEPQFADIPTISKLSDEFEINVALHNHPEPSRYWSPDIVLNTIKGQSKRIGACADIGHWVRSGLDPVECLKKLDGHVHQLHVKDLHEKGKGGHDVNWGDGVSNIKGVLQELKRQGFKGPLFAEYEHNWDTNQADVAQSVKNFRKFVQDLN